MTATPATPRAPLTALQTKHLLKEGSIVLWLYRGEVEEGTVQSIRGDTAALIWLEGYRSRNDDVPMDEILSVHAKHAPEHQLSVFTGKGFLTEAGQRWLDANPPAPRPALTPSIDSSELRLHHLFLSEGTVTARLP